MEVELFSCQEHMSNSFSHYHIKKHEQHHDDVLPPEEQLGGEMKFACKHAIILSHLPAHMLKGGIFLLIKTGPRNRKADLAKAKRFIKAFFIVYSL